jgi:hypothetical protein
MLVLWAAACGRATAPSPPAPADTACVAWPGTGAQVDSATVVLTWPLDPARHARPTNPGERFVVAQAYEPLVGTDCLGRLTPRLATAWATVDGGRRVRLVLRDSARFWSGDVVTVHDVMTSWKMTGQLRWAVVARRLAQSATVIDDRTLEIDCDPGGGQIIGGRTGTTAPERCASLTALGSAELAVTRNAGGSGWPEGTGRYMIRDTSSSPSATRRALVLGPVDRGPGTRLLIHAVGGADARDLVDTGVDLLLTDDPAVASYAAARAEAASLPLGWDRTWVLMTPSSRSTHPDSVVDRTVPLREALARDAVRAEARGAAWPDWLRDLRACSATTAGRPASRTNSRIVVSQGEPIARGLAERLVALAAGGPAAGRDSSLALLAPGLHALGGRVTAVPAAPNDFALLLRDGSEVGYVMPVPRRSLAPCIEAERLATMAPWLVADGVERAVAAHIAPLIDTRLRAVVRRDWLALTMTWDSAVVVSRP